MKRETIIKKSLNAQQLGRTENSSEVKVSPQSNLTTLDNLVDKHLQTLQEALEEKDKIIKNLEQKISALEAQNSDLDYLLTDKKKKVKEPIILLDEAKKNSKLTKISGILTSNIRSKPSSQIDYMAFFRINTNTSNYIIGFREHTLEKCIAEECRECEIPVIFRIDSKTASKYCKFPDNWHNSDCPNLTPKPNLEKGDKVILEGIFANSKKSNRPSFTCYSYQVIKN